MRWLINIYNPALPDAKEHFWVDSHNDREAAWEHHLRWLRNKCLGPPKASKDSIVAQLKEQNIIGVYMITDINDELILPGQYKYQLKGWRTSVQVTVEELDGVLYLGSNKDVYPMLLNDISMDSTMERIGD